MTGFSVLLFNKVNQHHKTDISSRQVIEALKISGFDYNMDKVRLLMSPFDVTHKNTIDVDDFMTLMYELLMEVNMRIRNLSGQLIMTDAPADVCAGYKGSCIRNTVGSRGEGIENIENTETSTSLHIPRYLPPENGVLKIKIFDGVTRKKLYKVCYYLICMILYVYYAVLHAYGIKCFLSYRTLLPYNNTRLPSC